MSDSWKQLHDLGLTTQSDLPVANLLTQNPWYIRLLHGFCGWLASWFILGFFAMAFSLVFEHAMVALVLGLMLNIGAMIYYKKKQDSDFFEQMVLVFSLAGQLLVGFALLDHFGWSSRMSWFVLGLYQLVLLYFIEQNIHRYLTAFFGFSALLWGLFGQRYFTLAWLLVSMGFSITWLKRPVWRGLTPLIKPVAVSLAVIALLLTIYRLDRSWYVMGMTEGVLGHEWLSNVVQVGLLILVLWTAKHYASESDIQWHDHKWRLSILITTLVALTYFIPQTLVAILLLITGKARHQWWMQAFGVIAMLFFFGWYYYWLDITLLQKSGILLLLGITIMTAYLIIKPKNKTSSNQSLPFDWPRQMTVLSVVLALVITNFVIYDKEQTIESGERIYLKLAPVDPRSLMQGDYMNLRYALAQAIDRSSDDDLAIIDLDDQRVASFVAVYRGESLQNNQRLLAFKVRRSEVKIGSQAFFFQEGQAPLFDQAAFGELVLTDDGKTLLVGLRDAELNLLGKNRLD